MFGHRFSSRIWVLSAIAGAAIFASPIANAATITIVNNDGADEGFNDPSSRAAVGGNTATTLGGQRLKVFERAAALWGAKLVSSVPITVRSQFDPQTCNATSTILGSAGPITLNQNFPNAPVPNVWYVSAQADSLAGSDLSAGVNPDINATFNSAIGTTCAFPNVWYYGLDGNPPSGTIDLLSVVIHELGHGLGFLSLVNVSTGTKFNGADDAYMRNLENHGATPPDYPSMSNAQRLAAATATGNLHWTGANVRAASGVLSDGRVGDHVRMYAPSAISGGSSVSHWDTVLTPNQVMEPQYTQPLLTFALELELFKDLGWGVVVPGGGGGGVKAHDFDGNSKSDILWRNTSGETGMWLMNGGSIATAPSLGVVPNNWSIVGQRDFSSIPDGKSDLLWLNTAGDIGIWFMDGGTTLSLAGLGNVGTTWSVVGTGDFNGDGKADILWRSTSGDVGIWFMNGGTVLSTAPLGNPGTSWSVVGTGDFDGNGIIDILWRSTSHDIGIWFMKAGGTVLSTAPLGNVGPTWLVAGTGNFDGDIVGKTDILWRSTSNEVGIWFMNGASVTPVGIGNVGPTWFVASVGNYDGNATADILWRSTSNDIGIWFMNGGTLVSTAALGNVGPNWLVQNAGSN